MTLYMFMFILFFSISNLLATVSYAVKEEIHVVIPKSNLCTWTLATSATVLNMPYIVHLVHSKDIGDEITKRLFYYGRKFDTFLNYSSVLVRRGSLFSEVSLKQNILVNTTLLGLQSSMYTFANA